MAAPTTLLSSRAVGNREDLTDIISNISPEETPFYTTFGKTKASGVYHEWQTDALANAADNAKVEGATYTFTEHARRTRLGNHVQYFTTPVSVSDLQREVSTAGIEDEFAYQLTKKLKEHKRDIEYALVNGTGNSGATGTARRLKGVLAWITSNVETGTGTGAEALTENMFNDLLQEIWEEGGEPGHAFANGFNKRKISDFTGGSTKNVDAGEKVVFKGVDIYDSDFGRIKVIPHRHITTSVVAILDVSLWKVASVIGTKKTDVAKTSASTQAVIETYLTLEARNEKGNGQIIGLKTS